MRYRSKNRREGKNNDMGKAFDKAGVSLIVALLSFMIFYRVSDSLWIGTICAILAVTTLFLLFRLIRPKEPKDKLSKRNFVRYVLLRGKDALKELVEKSFGENREIADADGHTLLRGEETTLIYYAYKFGTLSEEDVAKSYRLAEKYRCDAIYALTDHPDRKAIAVTEYVPQRFTVISGATLYKYLLKKGLIPPKSALRKKSGKVRLVLKTALSGSNAKYYVWAGLSTALLALFTPITTYYIVFSFLNLALALGCLFSGEKSDGKNGLFRE